MESLSWEEPIVEGVVLSLSETAPFTGIGDSWLDNIPSMGTSDESLSFNDNEWTNPITPLDASSLDPTINGSGVGFQLPGDLNAFEGSPLKSKRVTAKRLTLEFPKLSPSDEEILTSEAFSHVPDVSEGAYKRITDFYLDQYGWTETGELDNFPKCVQATLWDLPASFNVWELDRPLPSSASLWRCEDAASWQAQEPRPSLASLFEDRSLNLNMMQTLDSPARLVVLATFFVMEKTQHSVSSWAFKARPGFVKDSDNIAAALDIEFEKLGCLSDGEDESAPSGRTLRKTYHLAFILRKVPLRILGMSLGYKATSQSAEMARAQLSRYFNNEAKDAREILLHAATLFRIIREQTMITFLDPFWLLIASTYIQAYIRGADLTAHNMQRDSSSRFYQPIRVDYNMSDTIRTRWIQSGIPHKMHITGVGILGSKESVRILVNETIKILTSKAGWPNISSPIAHSFDMIVSREEGEWKGEGIDPCTSRHFRQVG
ncbi:hypothetical protein NM208_g14854 [Fusarium decemcellulare]|uniref:Uncharacterized protein n=1 Tax=Fusarium decemcellulare TaxID=57161 RepID=A0ACC1RGK0_9HYPO|nr:hypothetical protein NM208_g14854 [Fusarium decemcellulare]